MIYQQTTQIPNMLVDQYLPTLSGSEVKVLWVINRQTYGWIDKRTGLRKTRDWISHGQFITKTGLSRRVISKTLESLVAKRLINITCRNGNLLHSTEERRGKSALYYSINLCTKRQPLVHFTTLTSAESAHNKTNYTKIKETKLKETKLKRGLGVRSIGEILRSGEYRLLEGSN